MFGLFSGIAIVNKWRFDFIGNPPADVGAWSTRPMSESRSTTDADEADNCLDNLKKSNIITASDNPRYLGVLQDTLRYPWVFFKFFKG